MKIVQINATCGVGSTGKICLAISELLTENSVENYIIHSGSTNRYHLGISCANKQYTRFQAMKSKILGNYGFNSRKATETIIEQLEQINPDIVHLHNIHGHDCNLDILFKYFKQKRTKLIWTFHDCWAFTAYCPHFTFVMCDKWKIRCNNCPQKKKFSLFFDRSMELYEKKRKLFSNLDLTIVTPSKWLANTVKQSFLSNYTVKVIYNGIDLDVFKPVVSNFKKNYGIIDGKYIVLGVAFAWDVRKGLDVFIELYHRLPKNKYQIVLVGTDEKLDKRLPIGIISIHRTQNQMELTEIYNAADVFVNPTREEVLGLVNIEALACATPGVTFNSGGSPECYDDNCGTFVTYNDIDKLENEIIRICTTKPYSREQCVKKAKEFDKAELFKEYIELYERVITAGNKRN